MLKQRVITALILAPLILSAIYFLPTPIVAVILAGIVLIGAWEWAGLSGFDQPAIRIAYTILFGILLYFCYPLISQPSLNLVLGAACLWWIMALFVIVIAQKSDSLPAQNKFVFLANGLLVLLPSWMAAVFLHGDLKLGPVWLLFLFVLIWTADIGAYFAGRTFGRNKLADKISPGKSWEGVVGGLVAVLIVAVLVLPKLTGSGESSLGLIILCLITAMVSVLGDLTESVVKRIAGKKDSGNILPGHGGVMDRIDSLTAAAPIFSSGLIFLSYTA